MQNRMLNFTYISEDEKTECFVFNCERANENKLGIIYVDFSNQQHDSHRQYKHSIINFINSADFLI